MCAAADRARTGGRRRERGATLVEAIVFIVIVLIALGSVLGLLALTTGRSADPLIVRQSLAIAESLLQEVLAQPVGTTDPDGGAEEQGPEAGEARGSTTLPFDHVNDYEGYAMTGVVSADGTAVPALAGYRASVTAVPQGFNGLPADFGWLVTVTVTAPDGSALALQGFRARTQ